MAREEEEEEEQQQQQERGASHQQSKRNGLSDRSTHQAAEASLDAIRQWVLSCHKIDQQDVVTSSSSRQENDAVHMEVSYSMLSNSVYLGDFDIIHHLDLIAELVVEETMEGTMESKASAQLLVNRVARIAGFVKTVVLLASRFEKELVLSHPLMKRVVLRPASLLLVLQQLPGENDYDDEEEDGDEERDDNNDSVYPTESLIAKSSSMSRKAAMLPISSQSLTFAVKLESWILTMMDSKDESVRLRAIDYLDHVSQLTLDDYRQILNDFGHRSSLSSSSSSTTPSPHTALERGSSVAAIYAAVPATASEDELLHEFRELRARLFDAVSRFRFLTILLLAFSEREEERAVQIPIVRYALARATKRPFVNLMNACDFFFHALLVLVWRRWILRDVEFARLPDTADDGTGSAPPIWNDIGVYLASASASYFVFRLLGDSLALARVSTDLAVTNFFSLRVLVLVGLLVSMFLGTFGATYLSRRYFAAAAFSVVLLWVKVVLFLQVVNEKLAAYVLAFLQILKDLFMFVVLVFVISIGFGDVLGFIYARDQLSCPTYTVFFNSTDEYYVLGEEVLDSELDEVIGARINSTTLRIGSTASSPLVDIGGFNTTKVTTNNPFCDSSRTNAYFAMYRLFLKNFEFSEFTLNPLTTFLFVLSSFLLIVVLTNVLIAIINMSYATAFATAKGLFGRARLSFVAQLIAIEDLLHPQPPPDQDNNNNNVDDYNDDMSVRTSRGVGKRLEQTLRLMLRTLAIVSIVLTAFSWCGGMWYTGNFFYPNHPVRRGYVSILLAIAGLVPTAVILIHTIIGWDVAYAPGGDGGGRPAAKVRRRWVRLTVHNPIVYYGFKKPLEWFSRLTLGVEDLGLQESKISEMQFRVRLLESRLRTMRAKLDEKVDRQLDKAERRFIPLLKKLE